jgi:hypothetical protein
MSPKRIRTLLCSLALVATAMPLVAQPARPATMWVVPVDVTQGFTAGRGTPVPFTASARAYVGLGVGAGGRFRVGPSAAVLYTNPDWEVAAGARAALRVFSLNIPMLSRWGVYLQAEQLYGTGEIAPASLALLTDLGILRFGVWGSHDWRHEVQTVEASIGVGLDALIPLLRPTRHREPDFGLASPPRETRP